MNACWSKLQCRVANCNASHSSTLHDALINSPQNTRSRPNVNIIETENESRSENVRPTSAEIHENSVTDDKKIESNVYLQTVRVKVHSPDGLSLETYALIDPGSRACLISDDLASKLELKGPMQQLSIKNVAQDVRPAMSKLVNFTISDPSDQGKTAIRVH